MLVGGRDAERRENEDEDKEVVDRQRQLDQVPGEKFQAPHGPEKMVHADVEKERQRDPSYAPGKSLFRLDLVLPLVEDEEIERQHAKDETREPRP